MAPSSTSGATRPVVRSPHRNVVVCQCPCGTVQTRRSPFRAHPRAGVKAVVAQVSSRKTSRLGSNVLQFRPGPAHLFYVLAILLGGPEVLFLSVRPSRVTTFHITA